jgi:hypothetical protein
VIDGGGPAHSWSPITSIPPFAATTEINMTDEDEAEAHGPPTPLEILSTNIHLHRSVMDLLMQGPWHMMSPMVVQQYLWRRPDMAGRVDAWRRAGQQELARRKEQRLAE